MDKVKLGFFQKVYYSIAGFNYYKYFIKQSKWKAIVYLLLLALILGIISMIPFVYYFNNITNEMATGFSKSVPDFTFENGKLDVRGQMPIIISNSGTTIIIDTSVNTDESILDNYDNALLITSDRMIQKSYANKQVTDFGLIQGFKIDKKGIETMMPQLSLLLKIVAAVIIIFGSIFFICFKFISALIISVIGLIINSVTKANLKYVDIFKLSVYSMTLPLLLGTLLNLFTFNVPFLPTILWMVFYLIASVYLWGAINIIKKEREIPPLPLIE